jgi:hypothetical protein
VAEGLRDLADETLGIFLCLALVDGRLLRRGLATATATAAAARGDDERGER